MNFFFILDEFFFGYDVGGVTNSGGVTSSVGVISSMRNA